MRCKRRNPVEFLNPKGGAMPPAFGVKQMTNTYNIEYTDTFGGEANYSWVKRAKVHMPELTHYGYDGGTNYARANKIANRELMRKAKAAMGLTNVRGVTSHYGDMIEFRPYGACTILFISYCDGE